MTLLGDIEEASRRVGPQCKVAAAREALPPDEAADFDVALREARYTAEAIAKSLRKRGITIQAGSVSRHRRRVCLCEQSNG